METTDTSSKTLKPASLSNPNIAVFTAGSYTKGLKMYDDLAAATFTTIVLWSARVDANGDFHLNNFGTPDVLVGHGTYNPGSNPNFAEWQSKVANLKNTNTTITRVELSIGSGADDPQSFLNIKAIYDGMSTKPELADNLVGNLKVLMATLKLDAICFDDEAAFDHDSSLWLVQQCNQLGMTVSICPCFESQQYWGDLVAAANTQSTLSIDAIYLQAWTTDGPGGWTLNGLNPTAGMWLQEGGLPLMTPTQVTNQLTTWQNPSSSTEVAIAGGWFYNANEVFVNDPTQMKAYSEAITSAFSGSSSTGA